MLRIAGRSVHATRVEIGRRLADEHPVGTLAGVGQQVAAVADARLGDLDHRRRQARGDPREGVAVDLEGLEVAGVDPDDLRAEVDGVAPNQLEAEEVIGHEFAGDED